MTYKNYSKAELLKELEWIASCLENSIEDDKKHHQEFPNVPSYYCYAACSVLSESIKGKLS